MKLYGLNTVIKDLEGNPIKSGSRDLTMRAAIITALAFEEPDAQGRPTLTGEARFKRWYIANSIQGAFDEVEISIEDLNLVKELVGKAFFMAVVGPVWTMLESVVQTQKEV
jgi:hypothetical protein